MNKLYFGDNLDILREAVTADYGVYPVRNSPGGSPRRTYPKIQILTIEEILNKTKRAEVPDLTAGGLTFKKAQKEKKDKKQEGMF